MSYYCTVELKFPVSEIGLIHLQLGVGRSVAGNEFWHTNTEQYEATAETLLHFVRNVTNSVNSNNNNK